MTEFPRHACDYAERLAAKCEPFRRQLEPDARELEDDGFESDPFGELDEAALRQRLSTATPALEISLSDRPASPFDRALYPGKRSLLSAD